MYNILDVKKILIDIYVNFWNCGNEFEYYVFYFKIIYKVKNKW